MSGRVRPFGARAERGFAQKESAAGRMLDDRLAGRRIARVGKAGTTGLDADRKGLDEMASGAKAQPHVLYPQRLQRIVLARRVNPFEEVGCRVDCNGVAKRFERSPSTRRKPQLHGLPAQARPVFQQIPERHEIEEMVRVHV